MTGLHLENYGFPLLYHLLSNMYIHNLPKPNENTWIVIQNCLMLRFRIYTVPDLSHHSLLWRHNGRDVVSNHQSRKCLLNRSFMRRSKKTPKLRVTVLCVVNSPEIGDFTVQMASNAENVSIWWRHHHCACRCLRTWRCLINKQHQLRDALFSRDILWRTLLWTANIYLTSVYDNLLSSGVIYDSVMIRWLSETLLSDR